MGSSSSFKQQYKIKEEDILKVCTKFQKPTEGIEEAMIGVSEEQTDEKLDDIAPGARQSEEDAE